MQINPVNEYRVEVELDAAETALLGLSFDTMDWADPETRRALWSLTGLMRREGYRVSLSGRVLIEAGKLPDGLKLCFTSLPKGRAPRLRIRKDVSLPVLRCESLRDAQCAALCLPDAVCTPYARGNAVWLLIEGPCTGLQLARAEEFGRLIRLHRAREILEEYSENEE
jgi:hypothetical protein